MKRIFLLFIILITINSIILSCTNFLISRGASIDGSTFISYAADSHVLYGELYYFPAAYHKEGEMLDIYEWDTGKYLGKIKQVRRTYAVVGNMNEFQVSIGETTFGGKKELRNKKGILDYGSLMYIALQRSRTAREAIKVMTSLVEKYGYYSEGETFSIADPNEVWIMDFIGKGEGKRGALWVARRVPEGYVSAHANQARIRQFPLNNHKNCMYAKDIISFAREKSWFKGKDKDFSFVDAYAPVDFGGARFCEARVWSFFRRVASSKDMDKYLDYVRGNGKAKPLPLWVKPDKKVSVQDIMTLMRDHFEGTEFDLSSGVGAGPFELPYRWRPLVWKYKGKKYFNERATSTQQTGFSFVAQARRWLPSPIGGILWFGVDDTSSTVYVPMYCGIKKTPYNFSTGVADFHHFSWDSAFWVFNVVSNFTYLRYKDMIRDVKKIRNYFEDKFVADIKKVDKAALSLYKQSEDFAREYLTKYCSEQASSVIKRWKKLFTDLIVKYMDGNVKDEHGKVTHPPYPKHWYKRIVEESGDKFLYKTGDKK